MTHIKEKLQKFKSQINLLKRKEELLIIADHDDTLFSREEQLEKEVLLRENRWEKWNEVMKKELGFEYMVENYYKNKRWPSEIRNKLRPWIDLILTAWIKEFQLMRIKATWINNINILVTKTAEEKIEELVKYIINTLKYIPTKIEVYEDRPKYFEKYKNDLEQLLETKIDIFFVDMDWNRWYKKIEKL